jgi:hypothetical protein
MKERIERHAKYTADVNFTYAELVELVRHFEASPPASGPLFTAFEKIKQGLPVEKIGPIGGDD